MTGFRDHGPFTDPGIHAGRVRQAGTGVAAIVQAIQGLFIHGDCLEYYGLAAGDFPHMSRETLPIAARLDRIVAADPRPLAVARDPARRETVTCRDYALAACAFLRTSGVEARVRCGFARYLAPGKLSDHWICEYRPKGGEPWRRADAQLDIPHQTHLGIGFDISALPEDSFLTADEAWRGCRAKTIDPDQCGHGSAVGEWFLRVNLARDLLALGDSITSGWDEWRAIAALAPKQNDADRRACDDIAGQIEALADRGAKGGPVAAPRPFWKTVETHPA